MRSQRTTGGLVAIALVLTFAACEDDDDEPVGQTADQTAGTTADAVGTSAPADIDETTRTTAGTVDTPTPSDDADEPTPTSATTVDTSTTSDATEADDETPKPCPDAPEEWRDTITGAAPPAPAPGALAEVVLPTDDDVIVAVFDALPEELIGAEKTTLSAPPSIIVEADYQAPDRASRDGFQAIDLGNHMFGSFLPEPRADMLVASFVLSDDDDITVDAAGHEDDLYWVTYVTTNSGVGVDGIEEVYTVAWGVACSQVAFIAGGPTESARDELVAAFIEAVNSGPGQE